MRRQTWHTEWGIHYDTAGAFGKPFHLKATLIAGAEGAWRQEQEDSDTVEDNGWHR